jgi:hypothetical protein
MQRAEVQPPTDVGSRTGFFQPVMQADCGARKRSLARLSDVRSNHEGEVSILCAYDRAHPADVLLVHAVTEVNSGVGIAVTGTILAVLFTGAIATPSWSAQQRTEFREAVTIAALALTLVAAALVGWGIARARCIANGQISTSVSQRKGAPTSDLRQGASGGVTQPVQ